MHEPPLRVPPRRRQRGSVLLLALILCGLVATLASSFGTSTRLQLDSARSTAAELHADLAAQSALEFAQRQVVLDPEWAGTLTGPVTLPNGASFDVSTSQANGLHEFAISATDARGVGGARLTATAQVNPGNSTADKALVFLGRELDMFDVHINGDFILADQLGKVFDWVSDANGVGDWQLGGPSSLEDFTLSWMTLNDTLFKYSDTVYVGAGTDERRLTQPVAMPAWNLDEYLTPGPGRVIFTEGGLYEKKTYTETVVFVLDPGEELTLRDARFHGGVVIWAPPDQDLRGPARNKVWLRDVSIGTGSGPHIGMLASATDVGMASTTGMGEHICFNDHQCGQNHCCVNGKKGGSQMHGFNFVRSMHHLVGLLAHGQLFVVDSLEHLEESNIIYHNQVGENPPSGVQTTSGLDSVRLASVREVYL